MSYRHHSVWAALGATMIVLVAASTPVLAVSWLHYDHVYLDHVGTWARGSCDAVSVRDGVVVFSDGPTLRVLRLAPDGTATEVANLVLDVPPAAIAIGDGMAYVACNNVTGTRPLYAINIRNPERPFITHRLDNAGPVRDLFIDGSLLYAAAVRLRIFDLADPRHLEEVAEINVGYASGVAVVNGLAYVTVNSSGLAVVDVSDPTAPALLGHVTGADDVFFRDVEILGNHLLVADSDFGLRTFSLADPVQPVLVGGVAAHNLARVTLAGSVAFTAAQGGGIRSFDVHDPTNPTQLDHISSAWCNALVAGNDLLFLAGADDGLEAYAIDEPDDLSFAWRRQTADEARDVAVQDDLLCVADGWAGLITVDVSNARAPRELGRFTVSNGYMQSVAVSGDLAYVLSQYAFNNRLYVVDVSDPATPIIRDSMGFSTWATGLDLVGDHVVVANGNNGIRIVDASDPDDLQLLGEVAVGYALDVVVRGTLAYVAAGSGGMVIVDIANPAQPAIIASLPTAGSTTCLAIDGVIAYLGVAFHGVAVVDISDPTQPTSLAFVTDSANILGIAVRDGMAYTSGGSSPAVRVIDVSDPHQPVIVDSPSVVGISHKLVAGANHLYVASRDYGVHVFVRHGPPPAGAAAALAHRCFPNPCNPLTNIEFELSRAGMVQVDIYDVAGRRVARPWSGALPSGRHQVAWDGRTSRGSSLASGTYIYRIGSQSGGATGRIQLVR